MIKLKQETWSKLWKHKFLAFTVFAIGLGFLLGIIYYLFLSKECKADIIYTLNNLNDLRYNNILKDLIMMSLLLVTSFFIIGYPLSTLFLMYEGFSFGFVFAGFINNFLLGGLIYSLIYILFSIVPIFLIIVFSKKILNISKNILKLLFKKDSVTLKNNVINNFRNSLYIIVLTLVINLFLYIVSLPILNFLDFLIK